VCKLQTIKNENASWVSSRIFTCPVIQILFLLLSFSALLHPASFFCCFPFSTSVALSFTRGGRNLVYHLQQSVVLLGENLSEHCHTFSGPTSFSFSLPPFLSWFRRGYIFYFYEGVKISGCFCKKPPLVLF